MLKHVGYIVYSNYIMNFRNSECVKIIIRYVSKILNVFSIVGFDLAVLIINSARRPLLFLGLVIVGFRPL